MTKATRTYDGPDRETIANWLLRCGWPACAAHVRHTMLDNAIAGWNVLAGEAGGMGRKTTLKQEEQKLREWGPCIVNIYTPAPDSAGNWSDLDVDREGTAEYLEAIGLYACAAVVRWTDRLETWAQIEDAPASLLRGLENRYRECFPKLAIAIEIMEYVTQPQEDPS